MKLTDIDLNNREELEALRAMLNVILGNDEDGAPAATAPGWPLPSNGVTSVAPGAVAPPAMITPQAAALGLPQLQSTGVELDTEGVPWDERIHSGGKTKTKAGVWTARKGLNDEAGVNAIKAQLRAQVAAGGAAPASIPPAGTAPAVIPQPQVPVVQPLPGVVGGALPPLAGVAPIALPDPVTFEAFMPRVSAAVGAGVLPPTALQAAMAHFQLQSVEHLEANRDYVPHVWAQLKAMHPALQ